MQFALPSAAVQCCCVTANLYEEQVSVGVIAVTQVSCEAVLQSSTEQRGMQFALPSAAVHCCCVTAHLYLHVHWCWVTAHLYGEAVL